MQTIFRTRSLAVLLVSAITPFLQAATFTVSITNDSGAGSLRAAITNANATPGPDIIAFSLPPATRTLSPLTALPILTDPVTLDGTTQPGFTVRPVVELSGASAPGNTTGLRLATTNSVVRGLVINRWRGSGIELNGGGGHVVENCYVGTGLSGTNDLGNNVNGILLIDSSGNRLGAISPAGRNLISGNEDHGIRLNGTNSVGNHILGNIIGLDESGQVDLGNTDHGILIDKAVGTIIGGTTPDSGNVISGNNGHGIRIEGVGARGTLIRNNLIGSDATGAVDLGNNQDGISVNGSPDTVIGGVDLGNLISGNGTVGIRLDGANVTNTVVAGNRVGTDQTGVLTLPNTGAGIEVANGARFNRIGGLQPGEGNTLAFNGGDGIFVGSGTNNAVRGNVHFDNGGLGIDLGRNGIDANDTTDGDTGANQGQNFPLLMRVVLGASSTEVTGELRSTPETVFALDLFASAAADPTGNGEGAQFLGTFSVITSSGGFVRFTNSLPVTPSRRFITATATDPAGNTSEFSPALRALTTLPANNFIVLNTSDTGPGSLRQAIIDATNAFNLGDRIIFNIPGPGPHTLSPASALPPLSAPLTLDAFTQAGASANTLTGGSDARYQIFLDGAAAPNNTDGLLITATGVTVRGLAITRFKGDGIELAASSSGALVEGCLLGLGPDGTDQGQNGSGVVVNGSGGHRIGGTTPAARNILSGNNRHGVELIGAGATGNRLEGNWIGLGMDGQLDRGNSQQGIRCDNAPANRLGGALPGAGNLISGNDQNGIELSNAGASNNVVQGNGIGVTALGGPLKNNASGVAIGAIGSRIGGPATGEGNRIAFNGQRGVSLLGGTNNVIRGNRIHANEGLGLDLGNNNRTANDAGDTDSGVNQLQNFPVLTEGRIDPGQTRLVGSLNSHASTTFQIDFYSSPTPDPSGNGEGDQYLGSASVTTDATGNASFTTVLNVQAAGRYLTATATDTAGNTSEFATNRVATSTLPPTTFTVTTVADAGPGSLRQALLDADASVAGAPHTIRFNIPGDGPHLITPQTALPVPALEAVIIDGFTQPGARPNTLAVGNDAQVKVVLDGTDQPVDHGLRFVVPGNTIRGLSIVSFRFNGLLLGGSNNVVEGCFVGLLPDGTAKGNGASGITLANTVFGTAGSSGNRIGGAAPSARNVVSGNGLGSGLFIAGGGGSNNLVFGNYIGSDPTGTSARSNRTGIHISGVEAPGNRIGGAAVGEGNLVSGNAGQGIQLAGAHRTVVEGNLIGTDATGRAPLPNRDHGVLVSASPGTRVGTTTPGAGNRIAFNGRNGVTLSSDGSSTNLTVRGNSIHDNVQLGFDLGDFGFVDFNDVGDTDTGANFRQNFPEITAGTVMADSVQIAGNLDTQPGGAYALDFYASQARDASEHGEGEQYLGSTTVNTDANGDASFNVNLPISAVGLFLTAIATDASGNSSEFSAAFKATSTLGGATYRVTNTQDAGPGSLRQALLDSNANPTSGNRIEFNIPGNGTQLIQPATLLPIITGAVTVDGYTQPGASPNSLTDGDDANLLIHLDASSPNMGAGLTVTDTHTTIRGLAITGFFPGVSLRGTNHTVAGCWIGLRPDGSERGNLFGVMLEQGRANTVGGTAPADRNVISANRESGVSVNLCPESVVAGNFIGTDPSGRIARPNERFGITAQGSGDAIIGGTVAAARNVIAGHPFAGVNVVGQSGHLIGNNIIGLDATGTNVLGNGSGLELFDVTGARLDANVISGNRFTGLVFSGIRDGNNIVTGNAIGTDITGTLDLGNGGAGISISATTAIQVGGLPAGEGNLIAFNGGDGIETVTTGTTVAIRGNRIFANANLGIDRGLPGPTPNDAGDSDDVANFPALTAATLNAASVRLIGNLNGGGARNYRLDFYASRTPDPSGFGEGAQFLGSTTNTTDAAGLASFDVTLPVVATGRWITATATDPSGDTSEFGPVFRATSARPAGSFTVTTSHDDGPGSLRAALIAGDSVLGSVNNSILFRIPGNGLHVITPLSPLPSPTEAVTVDGFSQPGAAANNVPERDAAIRLIQLDGAELSADEAGLTLAAQGGLVRGLILSQFKGAALELHGASNRVEGCLILSNHIAGVHIATGAGHSIGGPLPSQRNRFALNSPAHVVTESTAGGDLRVQGNFMGVTAGGTFETPNFDLDVILSSTGPSLIGGSLPGEANWMAGANPISINAGRAHTVRGNRVVSEGSPVPDLPVFGNDPGDADVGPNDLQNFPVVTAAIVTPAGTRVLGTLNSRPSSTFTLDVYSTPSGQVSRTLFLEQYLGHAAVTTDGSGNVTFEVVLPILAHRGRILATATDADGNTSESGPSALTTTEIPPPQLTVTRVADQGPGSLRSALLDAENTFATGPARIAFNLQGTGPHLIEPLSPLPALTHAATVDGFTQPGSTSGPDLKNAVLQIQLHGGSAGPEADGLVLSGPGHVVRGLIFTGFGGRCLVLSNAPGSRIEQNWFGFDGVTGVTAAQRPVAHRSRSARIQPLVLNSISDLQSSVGIDIVDLRTFGAKPTLELNGNLFANLQATALRVNQSTDLRLLGNSVGLDRDGQRFGIQSVEGFSFNDVERVEVIRGPTGSLYGANRIAGCLRGLTVRKGRDSLFRDSVIGGGDAGDWNLKNHIGMLLQDVQNSWVYRNNFSFNDRGLEVDGDGFGTRITANWLRDNLDYGFHSSSTAAGYRAGEFQSPNNFGAGIGSLFVLQGRGGFGCEFNTFGAYGNPFFIAPEATLAPPPQVRLGALGVIVSGFNANPFDRLTLYGSDPWNQRIGPQVNVVLEEGQTSVTYPLSGPLLSEANERIVAALMIGASTFTMLGFEVEGEADLATTLVSSGSIGLGDSTGTTRQQVELHFLNRGPNPASFVAELTASAASKIESIPRTQSSFTTNPFAPFEINPVRRAVLGANEMRFTGRLSPGEEIIEMVVLTQPAGKLIESSITPVDRSEKNPDDNFDSESFPESPLGSLPAEVRFRSGGLSTAPVLGEGQFHFDLENTGAHPIPALTWRISDSPSLKWTAKVTAQYEAVRDNNGLKVSLKQPFGVGTQIGFQLPYQAKNRPGYTFIPGAASGFLQAVDAPPPWGWGLFEITDPTQVDYGDAPNSYGTTRASNGPRHVAVPGFQLGFEVDRQADGVPGVNAEGDRGEEGVYFPEPLIPGQTVIVEVQASASGHLDAWFDWNRNGAFEHRPSMGLNEYVVDTLEGHPDPGESYPLQPGLTRLRLKVPQEASLGTTYARFRFSHDGGLTPLGAAGPGEVEDHRIEVYPRPPDFGDAPDFANSPGYPTLPSHDGAVHFLTVDSPRLGSARDGEAFPNIDAAGLGDDTHFGIPIPGADSSNDEDGVTLQGLLIPGGQATIRAVVSIPSGSTAKVDAWIDWNADFDWDDSGEQIATSVVASNGTNFFTLAVPLNAVVGFTYARVRVSQNGGLTPRGQVEGGEVEDYSLVILPPFECRITSYTRNRDTLLIQWQGQALLQQGPALDGPWDLVPGQFPGGALVSMTENARFFRLACP